MLTTEKRDQMINQIAGLPAQVSELVTTLTPAQISQGVNEGDWTIAQIVHHIVDSHVNGYIRMKLVVTETHPTLKPYDQDVWATLADVEGPIETSMVILNGLHQRWVMFLRSVSIDQWQRTGFHPEVGEVTLDDLLETYATHGEEHLTQMNALLSR